MTATARRTVMNLMNGRNTDGRFRCLVNHDGIFDCATTYYTTEELVSAAAPFAPSSEV